MKLFKNNMIRLMRLYHISIPILAVIAYCIYAILGSASAYLPDNDIFGILNTSQEYCFLLFMVFLYAGYEYIYNFKHSDIDEAISAHRKGLSKSLLSMLLVLLVPVFFVFLFFLAFNFITAAIGGITSSVYYLHVIAVCLLNFLLACVAAVLCGAVLALKLKRIASYTIMVLLIFLMSPALNMLLQLLSMKTGFDFFKVKYPFSLILPPNVGVVSDGFYGVSCEIPRWNLTLFWILLLVGVIVFTVTAAAKQKRIILSGVCVLLAVLNIAGYFRGGYIRNYDDSIGSIWYYDSKYYQTAPQIEKEAGFTVDSYSIQLDVFRDITARVSMKLNNPKKLKECIFMLYRDFDISYAVDQNVNPLTVNHDGDYLTISSEEPISEITLTYSGCSNILYSNAQAISLPGCFPYYPIAGFHIINDTEINILEDGTREILQREGYLPISNGFKAKYDITVNTPLQVYSNIEAVDAASNMFSGVVTYPTLMAGLMTEGESEKYEYYSYINDHKNCEITDEKIDKLQEVIYDYENSVGSEQHVDLTKMTIFQTPQVFQWATYGDLTLDDQIFFNGNLD